jgi:hypothetical protein
MTTATIETVRDSVRVFLHFTPRVIRRATYLPALITGAGHRAARRFVEFFTVNIRNRPHRVIPRDVHNDIAVAHLRLIPLAHDNYYQPPDRRFANICSEARLSRIQEGSTRQKFNDTFIPKSSDW